MEAGEYPGYWRPPHVARESNVPGTLSFKPGSYPSLRLIGSWKPVERALGSGPMDDPQVILGETKNAGAVTLARCIEDNTVINAPGFMSTDYNVLREKGAPPPEVFSRARTRVLDEAAFEDDN